MQIRLPLAVPPAAAALLVAGALAARAALPQQSGAVSLLNQANVQIDGAKAGDEAGWSVAGVGDVNGDGRPDLVVGARFASPNGASSGSAYVIFGQPSLTKVDLGNLGTHGFEIDGFDKNGEAGYAVAGVGDVNGDGLADVAVSAPFNDASATLTGNGAVYVVFGKSSTTPVDLSALGNGGYEIDGAASFDSAGYSVAGLGDVNGDGVPDIAVGALAADNNGRMTSGSVYVVFGKSSTTPVDLAALGNGGYEIDGAAAGDEAGQSVARAGDVNGDGRADLVLGAWDADNNGRTDSGSAYVVFGKASTTKIDLAALGSAGYRIDGAAATDHLGVSVGGGRDVNGDGRPDVIVGAEGADSNGRMQSGSAYVVFGKSSTTPVDAGSLGSGGFRIDGARAGDFAGGSVAAVGDVNGDGRPDLLVGAISALDSQGGDGGAAYLVFGRGGTTPVDLASLGSAGFRIEGAGGGSAGNAVASAGDYNGDGHPDVIVGDVDQSAGGRADSGSAYVLYGFASPSQPGGGGGGGGGGGADRTPPKISGFQVRPRSFAVARAATPVLARARRGARFRYRLSERATSTIAIARLLPGRRAGRACRAPSSRLRHARRCTRVRAVGKLVRRGQAAGPRAVVFSGRIGRRALRPGLYRATIHAVDPAGNRSRAVSARFRIVKG